MGATAAILSKGQISMCFGHPAGTCFEERLIQAYNLGMLEPIDEKDSGVRICSECASEGHKSVDCPTLI